MPHPSFFLRVRILSMRNSLRHYCGQCDLRSFVTLGRVPYFCAFRKSGDFSERGCHTQTLPHGHQLRISFFTVVESSSSGCRTLRLRVRVFTQCATLCDTTAGNVISTLSQHSLITFGPNHASTKPRRVGTRRSIPTCSKARSPSLFVTRSKSDAGHPRQPGKALRAHWHSNAANPRLGPVRILIDNT